MDRHTTPPPDPEVTDVSPSTHRRRRRAAAAAVGVSLAVGIVAGVAAANDPDPSTAPPPGAGPVLADPAEGGVISVLDTPARPDDAVRFPRRSLEPEVLRELDGMADLRRARLADERDGLRIYVAPGRQRGSICILAVGTTDETFAVNCPPVRVALAGQAMLGVRGGPDREWTFVGLAPDAATTVSGRDRSAGVQRNAYVLRVRGQAPETLRFRLRDGREREARMPSREAEEAGS